MWPERLQRALRRALERIWRQCGRNVSRELSGELRRGSGDNVTGTSPESSQESSGEDLASRWPERPQRALRRARERIWRQCGRNLSRELSEELWRGSGDNVAGTSPESSQKSSGEATRAPERRLRIALSAAGSPGPLLRDRRRIAELLLRRRGHLGPSCVTASELLFRRQGHLGPNSWWIARKHFFLRFTLHKKIRNLCRTNQRKLGHTPVCSAHDSKKNGDGMQESKKNGGRSQGCKFLYAARGKEKCYARIKEIWGYACLLRARFKEKCR